MFRVENMTSATMLSSYLRACTYVYIYICTRRTNKDRVGSTAIYTCTRAKYRAEHRYTHATDAIKRVSTTKKARERCIVVTSREVHEEILEKTNFPRQVSGFSGGRFGLFRNFTRIHFFNTHNTLVRPRRQLHCVARDLRDTPYTRACEYDAAVQG